MDFISCPCSATNIHPCGTYMTDWPVHSFVLPSSCWSPSSSCWSPSSSCWSPSSSCWSPSSSCWSPSFSCWSPSSSRGVNGVDYWAKVRSLSSSLLLSTIFFFFAFNRNPFLGTPSLAPLPWHPSLSLASLACSITPTTPQCCHGAGLSRPCIPRLSIEGTGVRNHLLMF